MVQQKTEDCGVIHVRIGTSCRMYCNRAYNGTEVYAQNVERLLNVPALMLGDNMSVVLNTTVPLSVLKKKHLSIDYHRVREAVTDKVLRFAHVRSEENLADI